MSSLTPSKSQQALAQESIKEELIKSKQVPLASWKEKVTYLSSDNSLLDQVQTFDVITSYLNICQDLDKTLLSSLLEKLRIYFDLGVNSNEFV